MTVAENLDEQKPEDTATATDVKTPEDATAVPAVEIVQTVETPATNENRPKLGRRERGLLSKVAKAEEALSERERALQAKETEAEMLRLQLQQLARQQQKPEQSGDVMPTLESCGYDESAFTARMMEWQEGRLKKTVSEQLGRQRQGEQVEKFRENRTRALETHYERADKLGLPDYDEVEAKAAKILGKDITEEFAACGKDTAPTLYFLGKNPEKAQEIRDIFDENPALGTLELGMLMASLKVRPKTQNAQTDVDESAGGGASKGRDWNRELDRMRDQVSKGAKSMQDLLKFKRDAEAAGVKL